jgi:hypothetical protein
MARKVILSVSFLINSFFLIAQLRDQNAETIRRYIYMADTSNALLDSLQFSFDSISVNAKVYSDKIITTNHFEKSKSELKIEFFLKDNAVAFVRVIEKSPLFNDLSRFSEFYFGNCQLFYESYYRSIRVCMPIYLDQNMDDLYGYNKALVGDFLKRYVTELFFRISAMTSFGAY